VDTTVTLGEDGKGSEAATRWALTLVYHESGDRTGTRIYLEPSSRIELGRGAECFGPAALAGEGVSRQHAAVEVNALDELLVRDADSRNGTFVNGKRVRVHALAAGDVISVGPNMVLVGRAEPVDIEGTESPAQNQVMSIARRMATAATPVLLSGETGTGKDRLAAIIHQHSGRTGPMVTIRCGALDEDSVSRDLFGWAEGERGPDDPGRPGLLEAADTGTLYLDAIEDAPDSLQASLLGFLENGESRRIGATEPVHLDVRVIASTRRVGPALRGAGLRPAFVQRLERWVLPLPPLRERREDILPMSADFAEEFSGETRRFHRKLRLALLRQRYPGNVRELRSVIESVVVEHEGDGPYELTPTMAQRLASGDLLNSRISRMSLTGSSMVVEASGAWVRVDGETIDLSKRRALRYLVAGLAERRLAAPGSASTLQDLLAIGWPGEKVLPEAGRNRVFVALTTLRKLGLRDVIVRDDDGYMFDPELPVRLEGSTT
jgi:hypothetical protein